MNYTEKLIPALVETELKEANRKNPPFRSLHEGHAVLREEVEEAQDEMKMVDFHLEQMWGFIKADMPWEAKGAAAALKNRAIRAAAEAIQAAAMAEKIQAIGKEE